jgi:diguanylate cyclase (GGDEF)-like protein
MRWLSHVSPGLLPFSRKAEPAQSRACYEGLARQIPLLYLVVLANFVGMWLIAAPNLSAGMAPLYLLVGLVFWRLTHWLRLQRRELTIAHIRKAIRQTAGFAFVISVGFAVWGHYLLSANPDVVWLVALFAGLAATGAAYGLMSFPLAAAIPIVAICMTLAGRLLFMEQHEATIVGICLALVSILILRILVLQNRAMQEMVGGQIALENERKNLVRAERNATLAARTDALTGLANRRAFMETLTKYRSECDDGKYTLGLIDLDEFKPINDLFGHNAGDAILQGIAHLLTEALPEGVFLARMGGDEFAILAPQFDDEAKARALGRQVCAVASQPIEYLGRQHVVGVSCGIALVDSSVDISSALQFADQALYKAKKSSASLQLYDENLQDEVQRRALMERLIVTNSITDELKVVYQPIADLHRPGNVLAYEVLARWTNPELG